MDMVLFHTLWTVALLVLFIGIWAWAWSSKRKKRFDEAARLALDDNDEPVAPDHSEKKTHG